MGATHRTRRQPQLGFRRHRNLTALSLAVALFTVACASETPQDSSSEPKVMKLFSIEALTGASAATGLAAKRGEEIAVKQINDAGGFEIDGTRYTIELESGDMADDASQSIALFRQASDDSSVIAAVGPMLSIGYLALVPLAEQMQMPLVGTGSAAPVEEWNPWAMRVGLVQSVALPALYETVKNELGNLERVAIMYDETNDALVADREITKDLASEIGYSVVADVAFKAEDRDFSAIVSTVEASNPDVVFTAGAPADLGPLVIQLRNGGVSVPLLTSFANSSYAEVWEGSKGMVEGDYTWIAIDVNSMAGPLAKFAEDYDAAYPGETINPGAIFGYDAIHAAVAAAKQAGTVTDRTKFQEALGNLDLETPIGSHIKIDNPPSGDNQSARVSILQITGNAEYEVIGP